MYKEDLIVFLQSGIVANVINFYLEVFSLNNDKQCVGNCCDDIKTLIPGFKSFSYPPFTIVADCIDGQLKVNIVKEDNTYKVVEM